MSTDSSTANIDAIFDLAADSTPSAPTTTPPQDDTNSTNSTPTNTPQSNAGASSADATTSLYPNVVRTLTQSEAGEANPEGTLTVAEFAAHLTVENIKAGAGVEGVVQIGNIYTATKAARHPLPVVLVFADDDDQSEQKTAKVYLPVAEATAAYANRPARGEGGNAAASKRSQDELLTDAAKKAITLASIQVRLDRAKEQQNKAVSQLEKYHGWLAEYFKGTELSTVTDENGEPRPETQDEANKRALTAAIAERAAKIEEEEALKADAAKNADLPDKE